MPSRSRQATNWPPHHGKTIPWRQTYRSGSRADRMLREIEVSVPPLIADEIVMLSGELTAAIEEATKQIATLDSVYPDELDALGSMLLRTESVASSKIERVEAPIDDYARAMGGSKANATASSMVAATEALDAMIATVTASGSIDLTNLAEAQAILIRDDPEERHHAGRLRTVQNWIGGNDHSPRGAAYIPPPPDLVPGLTEDLIKFSNRGDLPALAQAALAHAQFESIHPFTDGNGRIGRGLVNAILRRRCVTSHVVIPLASALVVQRDAYFEMLGAYREGDAIPILHGFATAAAVAAREAQTTAHNLQGIPEQWHERLGRVRRGSSTHQLLRLLPGTPVLTADDAANLVDASTSSVYEALARLTESGILGNLTDRRRNQIFGAPDILAELSDLDLRIGEAARA